MSKLPPDFFFGVSNAAGQVEDQLEDNWLSFARQGRIPNFTDIPLAHERLRFWSAPEVELDLAQELGVQVFRLSLAWERLVPAPGVWDDSAAARYREILLMIKARGMRAMVTLFHHSIPPWLQADGGWTKRSSAEHFGFYAQRAHAVFGDLVAYWITLNEPVPWSFLTYTEGVFPPGKRGSWRAHFKALRHMAQAHNQFHQHVSGRLPVGIAHHMGHHRGRGPFNHLLSRVTDYLAHWHFLQRLKGHMDFFGINYYGAEWITLQGPAQYEDREFSDAGRAVSPQGLHVLLQKIHRRYPTLPILLTENGVGDGTDQLRGAYLCEHLAVIEAAIGAGIPVQGYVHWTLSDNFEWSDGYGPKFGLVEVRRATELQRVPRPSFFLYRSIIAARGTTPEQRQAAWESYRTMVGKPRPYWRAVDGKSARTEAYGRPTPDHDWRFTGA